MNRHLKLFLASGFYIGLIPGAPGTYASVVTASILFLVDRSSQRIRPELHAGTVCLIAVVGVYLAAEVSRIRRDPDPQVVVIDEIAGQLATFLLLPVDVFNIILGTALFRVFDILKPYPIRRLEYLPGGIGIMSDDLMAAFYANLILRLVNLLLRG